MIAATLLAAAVSFTPCRVQDVDARCAEVRVPAIALHVTVVPATVRPARDPIFVLAGGPGQAASSLTSFAARTLAAARKNRDLVFVDQRGTGGSNGLYCDLGDDPTELFPLAKVEQCRDALAKRADLRAYTTADAVRDLEAVRRALGYRKLNFFGTSYGTRVAIEYARRYPRRVRSIILKGIVSPSLRYTVDPALATQAALEKLEAAAPSLRADLETALAHVPAGITRDTIAVEARNSLHDVEAAEGFPALIHRAAGGDWKELIERAREYRARLSKGLAFGMYFSVTCAEDVWRVSDAEAKRLTAGTLAGDFWHRQLARACAVWPHAAPRREIAKPFRSPVPALLLSGAYDPVTPPRFGDEVARLFPNSRHVVATNASHSFDRLEGCVDVMMNRFIEEPDPKRVDASCVEKITPVRPAD